MTAISLAAGSLSFLSDGSLFWRAWTLDLLILVTMVADRVSGHFTGQMVSLSVVGGILMTVVLITLKNLITPMTPIYRQLDKVFGSPGSAAVEIAAESVLTAIGLLLGFFFFLMTFKPTARLIFGPKPNHKG